MRISLWVTLFLISGVICFSQAIAQRPVKAAPGFTLPDSSGKKYALSDFRGKVVFLDLWASWCLPCRMETPYLRKISNRYKKRDDIVFIGIAVADKPPAWRKALQQDKPGWLQLFDNYNDVINNYEATSVPRFVLIDKNGNIVNFNAPSPSRGNRLTAMIDKELKRSYAGNDPE